MMVLSSLVQQVGLHQEVVIPAGVSMAIVDDIVGSDVKIIVQEHARVCYKKQVIDKTDFLVEQRRVYVHAHAEFNAALQVYAVKKYHLDLYLNACGVQAKITVTGGFIALAGDNIYLATYQNHTEINTHSNLFIKGLARDTSTIFYHGSISIPKSIPGCFASQKTAFLTQKAGAVVTAKPTMQVFTDLVTCMHASALGCISSDELFYLQARGLSYCKAENMLINAFFAEVGCIVPEGRSLRL